MTKTLLILAALLPFAAHGQDFTCQSALESADEYIPALCEHTHDALPGDYLDFGQLFVSPIEEPKMDWAAARKLCDQHYVFSVRDKRGVVTNHYDDSFQEPCHEVERHFSTEDGKSRVLQGREDLRRLNDFLAGSTAK